MIAPEKLIDAIPSPAIWVDAHSRVAGMNRTGEDLFDASVLGRHVVAVLRQPSVTTPVEQAIATQTPGQGRYSARGAGAERIFDVTITPFGGASGTILVFSDVTAAEAAGERRSEFVANVSHELRTPLTAISGFIETLRGPAKDDAAARSQFLDIMAKEAERMHRLVDDLLSLAKVEDMEGYRPTETIDLSQLIASVTKRLRKQADGRDIAIDLIGFDGASAVPGDPDQLMQVFLNLIENAIKYGGADHTVTVRLAALDNDPRLRGSGYEVSVTDQGEGIDARHLPRLTERFYRVDSHRSRGLGGTGLGLAIVKHIVSRHRGLLRIESELGHGSTFRVALPKK